jgi:hypothetical protein
MFVVFGRTSNHLNVYTCIVAYGIALPEIAEDSGSILHPGFIGPKPCCKVPGKITMHCRAWQAC